jgi:hypothetical protein
MFYSNLFGLYFVSPLFENVSFIFIIFKNVYNALGISAFYFVTSIENLTNSINIYK